MKQETAVEHDSFSTDPMFSRSTALLAEVQAERTGRQLNFLSRGFGVGKLICGDFSTLCRIEKTLQTTKLSSNGSRVNWRPGKPTCLRCLSRRLVRWDQRTTPRCLWALVPCPTQKAR